MHVRRPSGFAAFTVIWLGQIQSVLGTRMTSFVLSVTMWLQTGHASSLALMTVLNFGATVLLSPLAGSLVDRVGRRLMMVLSDIGCAASIGALLVAFIVGTPHAWEFYLVNTLTGAFLAFQYPAYSAAITQMMDKAQYARANAMISLATSVPAVFAPTLAAVLLSAVSAKAVLSIDLVSYALAIAMVYVVQVPERAGSPEAEQAGGAGKRPGFLEDGLAGFRYIVRHPGLFRLQGIAFMVNLLAAMGWILLIPMIMARTGNDQAQVGIVQSLGAIGGVVGGILITALKAPSRTMPWILLGALNFNLIGRFALGLSSSVYLWSVGWFAAWLCIPFIDGYAQAIFQQKVEPAIQGRVFAARQVLELISMPIAVGVVAPLADDYLGPWMEPHGLLAPVFGFAVGTSPGAGMALVFVVTGAIGTIVAIAGLCSPSVRELETRLPDPQSEEVTANV
jgi:MFS family permease